jgi:hypothetical protein
MKNLSDSTKIFSETDIIKMMEFLVTTYFFMFGGRVFQQTIDIPIGTNCGLLSLARGRNFTWDFARKTKGN